MVRLFKRSKKNADKKKVNNFSQLNNDSSEDINNAESVDSDSFPNAYVSKDYNDPESSAKRIEDESYTDNRDDDEVKESEKNPSGYAFLNLKKPKVKEKK